MTNRHLDTIFTQRLTLRAFRQSDAQDVFEACSNPILGHNAGWPPHQTIEDPSTMMLGYWLAEDQWNQGYTTEASKAVIDWGFAKGNLARITTCHFLFNDASRRVIEKCGFEKREVAPFPSDDPAEPDQDSQWYELAQESKPRTK